MALGLGQCVWRYWRVAVGNFGNSLEEYCNERSEAGVVEQVAK